MQPAMNDRHTTTGDGGPPAPSRPARASGHEDQATGARPIVNVRSPPPANDSPARVIAILALIDDLAVLAAELYFAGRLGRDDEESRPV